MSEQEENKQIINEETESVTEEVNEEIASVPEEIDEETESVAEEVNEEIEPVDDEEDNDILSQYNRDTSSDEESIDENTELLNEKLLDDLKTGDLLLFNDNSPGVFGWFTKMIKWGSHSNYSHIAMVLKNPTFLDKQLEGLYIWESSWEDNPDPQDGKHKLGVQITPIKEVLDAYKNGHVYVRKINTWEFSPFTNYNLKHIHDVVYNKPYDICPVDWVEAFLKKDINPQKTNRFFCSALVGYIYTKVGLLVPETDWSILAPNDFSLSGESVKFMPPFSLFPQEDKLQ